MSGVDQISHPVLGTKMWLRRLAWWLLLLVAVVVVGGGPQTSWGVLGCPDGPIEVVTNLYLVDCSNLQMAVAADAVTLVIERASGSINVASNRSQLSFSLRSSNVTGNISFGGGSHLFAEVWNSTVIGDEVMAYAVAPGAPRPPQNVTMRAIRSSLLGATSVTTFVASVGAAVDVSILLDHCTVRATRLVASIVAPSATGINLSISSSTIEVVGVRGGVLSVAGLVVATSVVNATVAVAMSSVACSGGTGGGVALFGSARTAGIAMTSWEHVTVSARDTNITVTVARDFVGVLGTATIAGCNWQDVSVAVVRSTIKVTVGSIVGILGAGNYNNGLTSWTNVVIVADSVAITSSARSQVGILGAAKLNDHLAWRNVSISLTSGSEINSTALQLAGIVGAAGYLGVITFTDVSMSMTTSRLNSTCGQYAAVLGIGNHNLVTWLNVTVYAKQSRLTIMAPEGFAGVLGVGNWDGAITWRDVSIVVIRSSVVATTAKSGLGVIGAATYLDSLSWQNVSVSVSHSNVTSVAAHIVGVIGAACNNGLEWQGVAIVADTVVVSSVAVDYVGVIGAANCHRPANWVNVTVFAVRSRIVSVARDAVGVLGAGTNAASVLQGQTPWASWADATVALVDSSLTCTHRDATGVVGASIVSVDAASIVNRGRESWRHVVVVAAGANVTVSSNVRGAVLGTSADTGSWDTVVAGVVMQTNVSVRGDGSSSVVLGGRGVWRDAVLLNASSSAIESNTMILCSNATIESCGRGEVPIPILELIDSVRRIDICGESCLDTRRTTVTETPTTTALITSESHLASITPPRNETTGGSRGPTTHLETVPSSPLPSHDTTTSEEDTRNNTTTTTTPSRGSTTHQNPTAGPDVSNTSRTSASRSSDPQEVVATMFNTSSVNMSTLQLPRFASDTTDLLSRQRDAEATIAQRLFAVEASASAAAGALSLVSAPLASNKGTTLSRLIGTRDCRSATAASRDEPDPMQFVYVVELGGSRSAGAIFSTVLLQLGIGAAATASAYTGRLPHIIVVHLAAFSYYGPNVASLAMSSFSYDDVKRRVETAVVGLLANIALLVFTTHSVWKLAEHHRPLWKDARDPLQPYLRIYGIVDFTSAFIVGVLTGTRGMPCSAQSALICLSCFANFAYTALLRPEAVAFDNGMNIVTTLLIFALSLLTAAAPAGSPFDDVIFGLAAVMAAWMYVLLAISLIRSLVKFVGRRREGNTATQSDISSGGTDGRRRRDGSGDDRELLVVQSVAVNPLVACDPSAQH